MSEKRLGKHTPAELKQWQALPLEVKVAMTGARIRAWINEYGESGVYIGFSGGKDSTVLSHLVDKFYPGNNIPRVFVNTGLEYPEIVQFVKEEPRAVLIKPKMNFKQVIEKYGYPFPSKDASEAIYDAKNYLKKLAKEENYTGSLVELAKSKSKWDMPYRVAMCLGTFEGYWGKKKRGEIAPDGIVNGARNNIASWGFLLDAPFDVSDKCCRVMKKNPSNDYAKETGRVAMTAEMACESKLRERIWYNYGCNMYDKKHPKSTPMAFWREQDVLQYIRDNNIKIASVYGEIVSDTSEDDVAEGQTRLEDFFGGECKLKTTGCDRTGCMFCGYGAHRDKPGKDRFARIKQTHPKIYEWIMKPWSEGGLGYKEVIDWINENGGKHIEY